MSDIVKRFRAFTKAWLSSRSNCHIIHAYNDIEITTHDLEQAADEIERLRKERDGLRRLVSVMLDNDPDDAVSDSGHTVLDLWRAEARQTLKDTPHD